MTPYNLWIVASAEGQSQKETMQMLLCMKSNDLENGESITVHFLSTSLKYSNHVSSIFSGSGMTSQIFCIVADAKIDDMMIKVNKKIKYHVR